MAQQTAVEWLINEIDHQFPEINIRRKEMIIDRAKQMEKEQHSKTFNQGVQWMQYHKDLVNGGTEYWDKKPLYFLEYYNETYNK